MRISVTAWLMLTMPDRTWILETVSHEQKHKHRPLQAGEIENYIQIMLSRYEDSHHFL